MTKDEVYKPSGDTVEPLVSAEEEAELMKALGIQEGEVPHDIHGLKLKRAYDRVASSVEGAENDDPDQEQDEQQYLTITRDAWDSLNNDFVRIQRMATVDRIKYLGYGTLAGSAITGLAFYLLK